MPKIMIFIDGSWLYANLHFLSQKYGDSYRLDYGKLPKVLGEMITGQLGNSGVDIVRTYLFGSIAVNYHLDDEQLVKNRRDFFEMLEEEFHYDLEIYPIDYHGRRLRKSDRHENDEFQPQEKCVDIALASSMLYYAAIPYAYDIAIAVIGDRDFMPMLKRVRRLGKRVAIASIRESCAMEYVDSRDEQRTRDFDIIWLGDLLDKLELKVEKRRVECRSPFHEGNKFVYTDEFIRKGSTFYCPECREKFRIQKLEQKKYIQSPTNSATAISEKLNSMEGEISNIIRDRGFGFIKTPSGDYYFHFTDLQKDVDFQKLKIGERVVFNVEIQPNPANNDKPNGKAGNVNVLE